MKKYIYKIVISCPKSESCKSGVCGASEMVIKADDRDEAEEKAINRALKICKKEGWNYRGVGFFGYC